MGKIILEDMDKSIIKDAAELLRSGEVVAIPTETVYGLGANALDENAVKKIFELKGRPSDNPLIVHVSSIEDASKYAYVSELANKVMRAFWPAPLTIVLKKKDVIPRSITGGLDTVAIRMPDNELALAIIKESGLPIAAPSANISGKPSPTKASHVRADLGDRIKLVVDGGECEVGLESTVLDLSTDKPAILRPGKITKEDLSPFLQVHSVMENVADSAVPKAPGMKYRHYAPTAQIVVYEGARSDVIRHINEDIANNDLDDERLGVIIESESKNEILCKNIYDIGSLSDEDEVARRLFDVLRQLDLDGIELCFIPALSDENIGKATMNRLLKAASYNVKKV